MMLSSSGMKLSVIIPAYNEEKYLGETLGAIRAALGWDRGG